ncbi:unnamed protein product [Polarella glacialis]|uniref:RNA helicase n=2 Tax=Polarella glacialis TaxID=89957 RepID=A0A813E441_POLGL|nr:unnamed protein product [Polarella glacialis]
MKICVNPAVPNILQDVKLFPGSFDGGYDLKLAALVGWVEKELCADESLLVLCVGRQTARDLKESPELALAAGTSGWTLPVALLDGQGPEAEHASYRQFVQGEARVLVSTFSLAGRGLDFSDSMAAADSRVNGLSLAVLLFDFPNNIREYANCIGRTARPGQRGLGRAVSFLPEGRFWIAGELIAMLDHCGQLVPEPLRRQHSDDAGFVAEMRAAMQKLLQPEAAAGDALPHVQCGGDFDAAKGVWILPASLPSYRRKLLHCLADELGLPHVSSGSDGLRRLHIARDRDALPDKFFVEGEEVLVADPRWPKEPTYRGMVVDPKINRRNRTLRVRLYNGRQSREVEADVNLVHVVSECSWSDGNSGPRLAPTTTGPRTI